MSYRGPRVNKGLRARPSLLKRALLPLALLLIVLILISRYVEGGELIWGELTLSLRALQALRPALALGFTTLAFALALVMTAFLIVKFKNIVKSLKEALRVKRAFLKPRGKKLSAFGVAYLVFAIFVLTLFSLRQAGRFGLISPNGVEEGEAVIEVPPPPAEEVVNVPMEFVSVARYLINASMLLFALSTSLIVLAFIFAKALTLRERALEEGVVEIEEAGEEAHKAAKEVAHEVEIAGSDPRAEVLKCYRRMCELLREAGVIAQKHQTAREFEEAVKRSVERAPEESIHKLTELFEEARYSHHEIYKRHVDEALLSLREIEELALREDVAKRRAQKV